MRALLGRGLLAIFLSFAVIFGSVAPASAAMENLRKYAGIVVDAKSGKVLYEEQADSRRYPASVSKVMTLYILFQELQAGNISLSTKMKVSKYAASAVPTKLGLKAGSEISVENAIKSLVTLSANDMARVIAEHISGTESKFAERMTATAKALGMSHTTYRNASGLPDGGQVTTVRDQAILGIAVYQHFPKYYAYFQTKSFTYGKRTYGNHNRLLGENGIDGIKTGYINAAGSNLLTAARKDGRHIVVVAFGFNKAAQRDAKVRELVKKYLSKGRQGDYLLTAQVPLPGRQGNAPVMVARSQEPVFVTPMPLPSFRREQMYAAAAQQAAQSIQQAPVVVASAPAPLPASQPADLSLQPAVQAANLLSGAPQPAERPDVIGAWISETLSLGAPPAALGETAPSAPLVPPVGVGEGGQAIDPMTSGSIAPVTAAAEQAAVIETAALGSPGNAAAVPGGWVVQIGAAPTETGAAQLLNEASSKVKTLTDFRAYTEKFEKAGQVYFRARFTGFGTRQAAAEICSALKKAQMSCLTMQS